MLAAQWFKLELEHLHDSSLCTIAHKHFWQVFNSISGVLFSFFPNCLTASLLRGLDWHQLSLMMQHTWLLSGSWILYSQCKEPVPPTIWQQLHNRTTQLLHRRRKIVCLLSELTFSHGEREDSREHGGHWPRGQWQVDHHRTPGLQMWRHRPEEAGEVWEGVCTGEEQKAWNLNV